MFTAIIFSLASFAAGYAIAPVYFYGHHRLKIKSKTLEEELFHLHHSFYGLIVIGIGLFFGLVQSSIFYLLVPLGLGLIVHHERTEPDLKGMTKFIYIRRWHGKNS